LTCPQPTYCRQLAEATEVEQKKNPVQKEFGFSSFSSFSMPTFSSLSFYKPTTVEAKSSLTGLPALMSFQQQMGRGWLGPTVRVDLQTMISTASQIAMLTWRGETPHLDMIVANSQLLG
jgi:hypothetical protein